MKKNNKKNTETTSSKVIEVTAEMHGSLKFKDDVTLKIDGKFNGSLETKGVLFIGENARVEADIIGEEIEVSGKVSGNILANKSLKLTKTAKLTGNLETKSLHIDFGAYFEGQSTMLSNKNKLTEAEVARYLQIDLSKLKDWVDKKKIPVEVNNNKNYFDREKIDSWISENKVNG